MNPRGLRRSLDSIDNEWSSPHHDAPGAPSDQPSAGTPSAWQVNAAGREVVEMTAAEIITKLRSGELSGSALAWRDGMGEWVALDALPAFQLAAPQSSRPYSSQPAESESRPKHMIIDEAGFETELTAPRAQVRIPDDVPSEEATVVKDPETLRPPALTDDTNPGVLGVIAVYERPVATIAFPEDAPTDEETVVSDSAPLSEPNASPKPEPKAEAKPEIPVAPKVEKESEPPVPPLPKMPSRALVSTAASTFLPPAAPEARSPSAAPRLSSLGPSKGGRPPSPSSPSITRKPSSPPFAAAAIPSQKPAPLVQALLNLAGSSAAKEAEPAAKSAPPPAPSARKESATATPRPERKTHVGLGPVPEPIAKIPADETPGPPAPTPTAATPAKTDIVSSPSQPEPVTVRKPITQAPAAETPSPEPAAAKAAVLEVEPEAVRPAPPPLPERGPRALAAIAAHTTPTIILREDRDADTLVTNFRPRVVPFRTTVIACGVSAALASLLTALIMPSSAPPPAAQPTAVAVAKAPPPVVTPPPPEPSPPEPAPVAASATPEVSAPEPEIPKVSARELAAASNASAKPRKVAATPRPRPTANPLDDPETALPEPTAPAPRETAETEAGTTETTGDGSSKSRGTWQTSPGF